MDSPPVRTPLVISYGGTLRALVHGSLTLQELTRAIYYFGCTREHFYDESTALEEMSCNNVVSQEQKIEFYRRLRELVQVAESEGRVGWRNRGELNTWEQLNQLLVGHDLPIVRPTDHDSPQTGRYSYPSVETAVEEQRLPYAVIWK